MLNFFKISVTLFLFFLSFVVYANDSLEKIDIDANFFSLNKKQENAFDSPSAIYQLSSEEIRRSGATSIPEALRLIPGVQVARINGHSYAITVRGFNRQFSNKLLVMIDGRIIYSTLFSGVFWDLHDYVLEDIEKIYEELEKYKYDFINFNCEHFVNFAKNKNYVSPQVLRWTSVALIGLAVYFLIKNKRL